MKTNPKHRLLTSKEDSQVCHQELREHLLTEMLLVQHRILGLHRNMAAWVAYDINK